MDFVQRFDVFVRKSRRFPLTGHVFNHVWNFEAAKRSFSFWLICFAFLACWLQFANKGNKSRKNVGMHVRHVTVVLWLERERVTVRCEFLVTLRTC